MSTSALHSQWRGCIPGAALAVLLAGVPAAAAQSVDYSRAEQMLTWNTLPLIYHVPPRPNWIRGAERGSRFWYRVDVPGGAEYNVVDPATGSSSSLFDVPRLATAMSLAADTSFAATALTLRDLEFGNGGRDLRTAIFVEGSRRFTCNVGAYTCTVGDTLPEQRRFARSPDGRWLAFVAGHNLWVKPASGGDSVQLTTDGEKLYGYGYSAPRPGQLRHKRVPRPTLQWSPDSRRIAVQRSDERNVRNLDLISSTSQRPQHYSYPYALPGDSIIPMIDIYIADLDARKTVKVDAPPQSMSVNGFNGMSDSTWITVKWAAGGDKLYFTHVDRGPRHVILYEADAASGSARPVLRDSSKTYLELNLESGGRPNWYVTRGGDVIWFSERDGWAHLYRYTLDGRQVNRITEGTWTVGEIKYVDDAAGYVYFTARGREPGLDPYYAKLYRASLSGGGLALLTPEDADHTIWFAPDGSGFVDQYSRVDVAPVTVLRSVAGRVVKELEKGDISALLATGWRYPEPFRVLARDGVTELYGVMYKPRDFDSTKSYPVLDHIYPGPQIIAAPKSFFPSKGDGLVYATMGQVQAVAELGFIVVHIDAMGTNLRSKAFHDTWYANMGDNGIPDHITAIKQLGASRPYMDLTRVGIYGHSGGGFASTDALLRYPDFFSAAVSTSGNHDNRTYYYGWAERYQGLLERDTLRKSDNYENQVNALLAKNLRGKLFLITGDMDDNVHPAMTINVANALIKANKSFDFLIMPDRDHGLTQEPYVIRRSWDFWVENLLGEEPPEDYRVAPPPAPGGGPR